MADLIDPTIQSEIKALELKYPVAVDVQTVEERGFSGVELVVVVVSFALGGIASGILSKMGEDLWIAAKSIGERIVQKTRAKAANNADKTSFLFEVRVNLEGADVLLLCRLEPDDAIGKLELFVKEIPVQANAIQLSLKQSVRETDLEQIEFEIIAENEWRQIQRRT